MHSEELREKLIAFAEAEISASEIEEWFVPRLPALISTPWSSDSDAVAVIELGLADLSSGTSTEDDFRRSIRSVLRENTSTWATYPQDSTHETESGSSNKTSRASQSSPGLEVTIQVV